jgi:predicted lipid-binding transport protein (Tim44 family)
MVTGMAYSGSTVLAFQPFFNQLGAGTTAIGFRGYSLGGLLRFRAFAGKPITIARVQGRYAYAAGQASSGTSVVDVSRGRVEPPHPDAISISPSELLAGPGR